MVDVYLRLMGDKAILDSGDVFQTPRTTPTFPTLVIQIRKCSEIVHAIGMTPRRLFAV